MWLPPTVAREEGAVLASTNDEPAIEPRIVVALADRWACVVLCAELRERGHVAGCADRLAAALLLPDPRQAGPVRAVLADRESLRDRDVAVLRWLRALGHGPAVILLTAADAPDVPGPWDRGLRRPVTIGAIADVLEESVRSTVLTPPDAHPDSMDLRLGPPWPSARCAPCGASRHCAPPRGAVELDQVRIALAQFAVEHQHGLSSTRTRKTARND